MRGPGPDGAAVLADAPPQSPRLTHTDTCAGSRAWWTTPASSSPIDPRSTASFSRAANAAAVWSASYPARLNRRSTTRCTRTRSGLKSAAAASVAAATATGAWNPNTWVASRTSPAYTPASTPVTST